MPATASVTRLMLLPADARRGPGPAGARVRRYHLARRPSEVEPAPVPARYAYLKRVYD